MTEEERHLKARKMELYAEIIEKFNAHVERIIIYVRIRYDKEAGVRTDWSDIQSSLHLSK